MGSRIWREFDVGEREYLFRKGEPSFFVYRCMDVPLVEFLDERRRGAIFQDAGSYVGLEAVLEMGCPRYTTAKPVYRDGVMKRARGDEVVVRGVSDDENEGLLRSMAMQVKELQKTQMDGVNQGVGDRVIRNLLRIQPYMDERGDKTCPYDSRVLSALSFTSQESVIRTMSKLKKRGVVGRTNGGYTLKDIDALKEMVGEW